MGGAGQEAVPPLPHRSLTSVAGTRDPTQPDPLAWPRTFPGKPFTLLPVSSEKSCEVTMRERVCVCVCSPCSLPLGCR